MIIDPNDFTAIRELLQKWGLMPGLVLLTHEHCDHIGGLNELRRTYPVTVAATEACSAGIGNQTRFAIGKITQSYVIQRADQTAFDIQFYIYADNEVRKLPADSLKKVYKWNRQGRCYLSVSDLAEIYREFGLNAEETQSGNYFPYTVRGEKTFSTGDSGNL